MAVPHGPVIVYITVSMPGVTPVTTPPVLEIDALPNIVVHVPPDTVEVKVIGLPKHTVAGPEMVPAVAPVTDTVCVR